MKLHLGSGNKPLKGYVNLDRLPFKGVNVIHDLDVYPYPFNDDTFNEIMAIGVLEHMLDFNKTINELARISKDGAIWIIRMPWYNSYSYGRDPTHFRGCTRETFIYWQKECGHRYGEDFDLEIIKIEEHPAFLGKFIFKPLRNFTGLILGEVIEGLTFTIKVEKKETKQ